MCICSVKMSVVAAAKVLDCFRQKSHPALARNEDKKIFFERKSLCFILSLQPRFLVALNLYLFPLWSDDDEKIFSF